MVPIAINDASGGAWQHTHGLDPSPYEAVLQDAEVEAGMPLPHHDLEIDYDAYVAEVAAIHFDEETGAPYWQEVHAGLKEEHGADFDIRDEIHADGMDAVRRYLPEADEAALRDRPFTDFLPAVYDPDDVDISKSSGTTGPKKLMPWDATVSDAAVDWYTHNLDRHGTGDGDWLACGPYGLYEKHMEGTANNRGGHLYFSGIETRELKKQFSSRNPLNILRGILRMSPTTTALKEDLASEPVENLASAPTVIEKLHGMLEDDDTKSSPADIDTILISGMGIDGDTVDELEEMYENATVLPMYATSFTGPAFDTPYTEDIQYYPMAPVATLDVRDEDGGDVEYGERGRVAINRIGPAFFWPNQVERETAVRVAAPDEALFDWDGIAAVRPLD